MALVVETGAGLPNAESYASVAYLKSFATGLGISIPSATTDLEQLLRRGMIPMRRGELYKGTKATKAQALDFPRVGVCIDGYVYESTELPVDLLNAHCAFTIAAAGMTDPMGLSPIVPVDAVGPMIEDTIGPMTTRYAEPSIQRTAPRVGMAEEYLAKLLRSSGGNLRVVRS